MYIHIMYMYYVLIDKNVFYKDLYFKDYFKK